MSTAGACGCADNQLSQQSVGSCEPAFCGTVDSAAPGGRSNYFLTFVAYHLETDPIAGNLNPNGWVTQHYPIWGFAQ